MPCFLVLIAFFFPRLVLILLALFSNYLANAYNNLLVPLLGFFFLPYTTLAYAWAKNSHGGVDGIYLIVVIIAVLVDLGVLGGGAKARRSRTVVVKPWWLYADYRATLPNDIYAPPEWNKRFPGFSPAPALVIQPDGVTRTTSVRVCREEAQTAETGTVYVSGRPAPKKGAPPHLASNPSL